jgi:amino acid transporter
VWALLVLLAIQGVGATAGSAGLVHNPVKNIGLRVSMALLGVVILILALARPTRRFFWVGR